MEHQPYRFFSFWAVGFFVLFNLYANYTSAQVIQELELKHIKLLMPDKLMLPAGPPVMGRAGFVLDSNGFIHLIDRGGSKPFVRIDPDSGDYIHYGSWGNGPGDVRRDGYQVLSIVENSLFVYDAFAFTLQEFDFDGNLLHYEVLNTLSMPGVFKVLDRDNALFTPIAAVRAISSNYWISTYSKTANGWQKNDQGLISFDENPDIISVKQNPAIGLGAIIHDIDGVIYLSTVYSSMIMAISPDGRTLFKSYEPDHAQLPVQEIQQAGSRFNMDPTNPTFYFLDIAVCSDYIYALYSGESYEDEDLRALFGSSGRLENSEIRPGEGNKIYVFDKRNGELLSKLNLDFYANAILATETKVFLVSWDEPISIHVIKNTAK